MALNEEESNGCPVQKWNKRRRAQPNAPRREEDRGKVPFHMPFILNEMNMGVWSCVRMAALQDMMKVTDITPTNLKAQMVPYHAYGRTYSTPSNAICLVGRRAWEDVWNTQ